MELPDIGGLMVAPRLRVQSANAISSPLTWGFPAITAFTGLAQALERKLAGTPDLQFDAVGVICHGYEAQVDSSSFVRTFNLTRNPVERDGGTAAIVEEGRIHLDITLIFGVNGPALLADETERRQMALHISETLAAMRIAGGSVMPVLSDGLRIPVQPELVRLHEDPAQCELQFRRWRRQWLPGFALVARDDLLASHRAQLQAGQADADTLDAWLDLTRLKHSPVLATDSDTASATVEWFTKRAAGNGWIVPVPVGYGALSPLYAPGEVAQARDASTAFRFVENLYSIGQWISPHRLNRVGDLLWYTQSDPQAGLYRCCNDFNPAQLQAQD